MQNEFFLVTSNSEMAEKIKRTFEGVYLLKCFSKITSALEEFRKLPPNFILCDTVINGVDGIEFVKEIVKVSNIPIVAVSERNEAQLKTLYLELGCDDYIQFPFDDFEFRARIKAVMRRCTNRHETENEINFRGLSINLTRYELRLFGKVVEIPPKEIELLFFLAQNTNKVFSRDALLDKIWGFDYYGDTRTVDVHINRIREKLSGYEMLWSIETVYGVGYKFVTNQI